MSDKQAANAGMLPPPEVSQQVEDLAGGFDEIDFSSAAKALSWGTPPSGGGRGNRGRGGRGGGHSQRGGGSGSGRGKLPIRNPPLNPKSSPWTPQPGGSSGGKGGRGPVYPPPGLASVFEDAESTGLPPVSIEDPITSEQVDHISQASSRMQEMIDEQAAYISLLTKRLETLEASHGVLLSQQTQLLKYYEGIKARENNEIRGPHSSVTLGEIGQNQGGGGPTSGSAKASGVKPRGIEPAPKPLSQGAEDKMVAKPTVKRRIQYD